MRGVNPRKVALTADDLGREVLPVHAQQAKDNLMACWFTSPRAIEVAGRTWAGGVASMLPVPEHAVDVYDDPALIIWFPGTYRAWAGGDIVAIELGVERRHLINRSFSDDHNNPALLMRDDRPPLVADTQHNTDDFVRVRRGTAPLDLATLGPTIEVDFGLGAGVSYAQMHHLGDDVLMLVRTKAIGSGPSGHRRFWSVATSSDWGVTWGSRIDLIDWADAGPDTRNQGYLISANDGAGQIHVQGSMHPTRPTHQSVWYLGINMPSGNLSRRDGTIIGNLATLGSPLRPSDLDEVEPVDSLTHRTWIEATGRDGSMVWSQWPADAPEDAVYRHARWDGSAWIVSDIVATGGPFPEPQANEDYQGGAQIDGDGDVWLSRHHDGTWRIERWTRSGSTWSLAETVAQAETRLVRPIVPDGRTTGPRVLWHVVDRYATFGLYISSLDWEGSGIPTPP